MPEIILNCLIFIISVMDTGISLYFMHTFFTRKAGYFKIAFVVLLASSATFYVLYTHSNMYINGLISILSIIVLSTFYKTTLPQKILSVFFLLTICIFIEAFTADISVSIGAIIYNEQMAYHFMEDKIAVFLALAFFNKSFPYLLIFILGMWFKDRSFILENRKIRMQYFLMMLISLLCFSVAIFTNKDFFHGKVSFFLCCFINLAMVLSNIIVYVVYYQMGKIDKLMYEKKLFQEEYQLKQEYYRELNAHQQEIRKIRHDMKNQLIGILSSISDQEKATAQIHTIMDEITATEQLFYCDNPALNTLLNVKLRIARDMKVQVTTDIKIPPNLHIEFGELSILLGNLLDNALTALENCPEDTRFLTIKLFLYSKCLVIICENSVPHKVTTLTTTKADTLYHGLGLKSIREIVKKYNGEFTTHSNNTSFKAEINIWLH